MNYYRGWRPPPFYEEYYPPQPNRSRSPVRREPTLKEFERYQKWLDKKISRMKEKEKAAEEEKKKKEPPKKQNISGPMWFAIFLGTLPITGIIYLHIVLALMSTITDKVQHIIK